MGEFNFKDILQNPQHMLPAHTEDLLAIIKAYPYAQSPRALLLKALKDKGSFKYNQALKTTAAYTTDRSILFDLITSEIFLQNEISEAIKQSNSSIKKLDVTAEDISVDKNTTIDDVLKQQILETKNVLDPELFTPKTQPDQVAHTQPAPKTTAQEAQQTSLTANNTAEEAAKDTLKIGTPLEFTQNEKHSFGEWLKLTHFSAIEREDAPKPEKEEELTKHTAPTERDKKFQLIDRFISKNPKLKPEKTPGKHQNLAEQQMIQPDMLMTETLARIYVEQKNYKKAIQSYKILSLKYPEKSGFFADQIKAIQKLQEQNK
ncbi:MAG: hypothetical protein GYB39_07950 [Algicola sp.]|nr:hypothetical protein [Algicola sp.]